MSSTKIISRTNILQLYKSLLRHGQQLNYTSKTFYFEYIRRQARSVSGENNNSQQQQQRIERLYNKGKVFLANNRLI